MKRILDALLLLLPLMAVCANLAFALEKQEGEVWRNLTIDAWDSACEDWILAGDVALDSNNDQALLAGPGSDIFVSSLQGRVENRNLRSLQMFGDIEVHLEFFLPEGSNGGIKLQGLYEIQLCDSYGKEKPKGNDCGGVYPRAKLGPYRTIDEGIPPRTNAAKPPGKWQTLDITFRAPRFDRQEKKVVNAQFVKVVLNGQVIHEKVELLWPTGYTWQKQEVARGPLFLQGDHGPIAYRNVRVRPIPTPPRPNIVLIMCDDMGWSDVGCYGGEINTPNIDRLATEGMRFTQFYNNAVCWTTRVSLMTGCYPRYPRPLLKRNIATLAEWLQTAGYQTALSGKWHLGRTDTTHPLDRGFDQFYGLLDGCCNFFDPYYRDPKYKWFITGEGYRYFADNRKRITKFPDDFYTTDAFSDRAVEMIQRMAKPTPASSAEVVSSQPFFLHVCYTAPHYPIHAKPIDMAKYRGKYARGWEALRGARHQRQIELGLVDPAWKLPAIDPEAKPWHEDTYPKEWQQRRMEAYAAMVDCMDQGIGRILAALEEASIAENTLVVFLSDNGAEWAEFPDTGPHQIPGAKEFYNTCGPGWAFAQNTPFRRYKTWMHEGGIATPMIVRWPGHVASGSIADTVAHVIDFLPTCLELAGIEPTKTFAGHKVLSVDGLSFASLLSGSAPAGETRDAEAYLFWELNGNRAARQGKWKLVMDAMRQEWELYDLEVDRTETNNLAVRFPARVERMEQAWRQWAKKTMVAEQ